MYDERRARAVQYTNALAVSHPWLHHHSSQPLCIIYYSFFCCFCCHCFCSAAVCRTLQQHATKCSASKEYSIVILGLSLTKLQYYYDEVGQRTKNKIKIARKNLLFVAVYELLLLVKKEGGRAGFQPTTAEPTEHRTEQCIYNEHIRDEVENEKKDQINGLQ